MRFGYVIPSFGVFAGAAAAADLVQVGDDLGYDDVWFGDHVVIPGYAAAITPPGWLDPLACCFIGLGRTRRISFGTDVLVAPYRHPALVAKMVATADHLSEGRMILGVGVGYLRGEFAILGADYARRGAVTDEHLDVLRLLWGSDGPVSYHGDHVAFDDAVFGPAPTQQPMPLWVGGNVAAARRRAALRGTGWHPLFPTPEQVRSRAGRDPDDAGRCRRSVHVLVLLRHHHVARRVADRTRHRDVGRAGGSARRLRLRAALPAGPDGRLRFVGTPDDVAADFAAYEAAGVEHITLRFAYGGPDESVDDFVRQLRWFATDVVPRFATTPV